DAIAVRRQLDQDPAPVVRIGKPAEETGFLQAVEPVRDRAARELHQPRQPARRAPVDLRLPVKQAEELPLGVVELELGERLGERAELLRTESTTYAREQAARRWLSEHLIAAGVRLAPGCTPRRQPLRSA